MIWVNKEGEDQPIGSQDNRRILLAGKSVRAKQLIGQEI